MNDTSTEGSAPVEHESLAAECLRRATLYYLREGGDFNGLPLERLADAVSANWSDMQAALLLLVRLGDTNVHWERIDLNPHINRRGFAPAEDQIAYLKALAHAPYHTCLYPSADVLARHLSAHTYADRPYSRELAQGAAQFEFHSFDLQVLEAYRNDPRYYYQCSDVGGSICITTEHSQGSKQVQESDQVLLETFGFSYDDEKNRSVAVFLRYLTRLSPHHQQIWRARQLPARQRLHPDYYRSTILGEWPEYLPLFEALCMKSGSLIR